MNSTEPIFRSESHRNAGSAISFWTWNKVVERIRDEGSLSRFHPHTIRHVALTDLARAGWDVLELKAFAGTPKDQYHRGLCSSRCAALGGGDGSNVDEYLRSSPAIANRDRASMTNLVVQPPIAVDELRALRRWSYARHTVLAYNDLHLIRFKKPILECCGKYNINVQRRVSLVRFVCYHMANLATPYWEWSA